MSTVVVNSTIAAAMASATAGDTILIPAGTYTEDVLVDQTFVFRGSGLPTISSVSGHCFEIVPNVLNVHIFDVRLAGPSGIGIFVNDAASAVSGLMTSGIEITGVWFDTPTGVFVDATSSQVICAIDINTCTFDNIPLSLYCVASGSVDATMDTWGLPYATKGAPDATEIVSTTFSPTATPVVDSVPYGTNADRAREGTRKFAVLGMGRGSQGLVL